MFPTAQVLQTLASVYLKLPFLHIKFRIFVFPRNLIMLNEHIYKTTIR
jgi:hypothetical protein